MENLTDLFKNIINADNLRNLTTSPEGLSMTQAVSISNRINQRCEDIEAKLNYINNASKIVDLAEKTYTLVQARMFPQNYDELIDELSDLRAVQAYLMESMKVKDNFLTGLNKFELKDSMLEKLVKTVYNIEKPEYPSILEKMPEEFIQSDLLVEKNIWDELSEDEFNSYIMNESKTASYGKIIHKDGQLDRLRKELPTLNSLEWINVKKDEKTPVVVYVHNTLDDLLQKHESIASKHNALEKKVNYVKSQIKDKLNKRNAEIISENNIKNNNYLNIFTEENTKFQNMLKDYNDKKTSINNEFSKYILGLKNNVSKYKIKIIKEISETVDKYNK